MRMHEKFPRGIFFAGLIVTMCAFAWTQADAQSANGPPNALQGFSQNRGQPVSIESRTMEMRDKNKVATFLGNVKLVQGDTTLKCNTLVVHYDQPTTKPGAASVALSGSAGRSQVRLIEVKGNVVVTQKDQTATGDNGIFDNTANTVTLTGNVTITQGQNVVRGDSLWVDLATGTSRVESAKAADGRVRALIQPNAARDQKGENGAGNSAVKPALKPAPAGSSSISSPTRPPGLY